MNTRQLVRVHRVLTSDACVSKIKKEELERREAKVANSNTMRQRGESGKGKINMGGLCFICCTAQGGDWIQCDTCQRWIHQECVPEVMREKMSSAIDVGGCLHVNCVRNGRSGMCL